jgi:predicted ATPase
MSSARGERLVRPVQKRPDATYDPLAWPYKLPPVVQLLEHGLDLPPGVTFLVGENGSGKSTLVEAIATAAGLNPEGGTRNARHSTYVSESPLHEAIQLVRSVGGTRWAYFLRGETMHSHYTYLEQIARESSGPPPPGLHEHSHGESFVELMRTRFVESGFYLLDEPEAALSFSSCLALIGVLDQVARNGGQVVCATHSPVITALPGATILQLDENGFRQVAWSDLDLVGHWRRYLADPQRYLRHLFG